jgi:hypothetical protein
MKLCPYHKDNNGWDDCSEGFEGCEMHRGNTIKDSYEDGECPDCCLPIPNDVSEGEECESCGHVFYEERETGEANFMGGDSGVDADDPNFFIIPEETS